MSFETIIAQDSLLADRVRLAIVTYLAKAKSVVEFNELLSALALTKGNLSSHMRKLEAAGIVAVNKEFINRKPRTTYEISKKGEKELLQYINALESVVQFLKKGSK
ncbi:transcriptional regulator [bacterium]|nr:transcriptional regulator [bacterium]